MQYTPANALIAQMLAVSILRKVQQSLTVAESGGLAGEVESDPAA
ncbi:hypothetical protein [Micromonospora sp. NPDC000668]